MQSYSDEANAELKRDKNRRGHEAKVDKMECDFCGKQAKRLKMVETDNGRISVCKECEKELK
jgi:predicted SprT family Zn-dependent metalloprotease